MSVQRSGGGGQVGEGEQLKQNRGENEKSFDL